MPQSGSTSVLGHTFGVDDDVLLPVPAGSGSSRSSLNPGSARRRRGGVDGYLRRSFAKRMREMWWRRSARVWERGSRAPATWGLRPRRAWCGRPLPYAPHYIGGSPKSCSPSLRIRPNTKTSQRWETYSRGEYYPRWDSQLFLRWGGRPPQVEPT